MTDSEKNREEILRLAYKEANEWLRHIDNYFWLISSALLAGTVFVIRIVLIETYNKNFLVVIVEVFIFLLWHWYYRYIKDFLLKEQGFLLEINKIERLWNIEILPNEEDITAELDKEIYPQFIKKFAKVKRAEFALIMVYCSYLVWSIVFFSILYKIIDIIILLMNGGEL